MRSRDYLTSLLRGIAGLAFVFYLGWNLYFLSVGRIPPSILYHTTGVPAPTTGCSRALAALLDFRVRESLTLNPFLLVFTTLLLLTLVCLMRQHREIREWLIPPNLTTAWFLALVCGWGYQMLFFQA